MPDIKREQNEVEGISKAKDVQKHRATTGRRNLFNKTHHPIDREPPAPEGRQESDPTKPVPK